MNEFQQSLYSDLTILVKTNEAFYSKDFVVDGIIYRIFNYRLASYTDFCLPNALECRGVMFEVDTDGFPIRLASLPPMKFFNYRENPFTMDIDLSNDNVHSVMDKRDGSLISTYLHNGQVRLKTKMSLFSEQAIAAMRWLDREENAMFKLQLEAASEAGITVNLEYTAPTNRIVLGYMDESLRVLNMRDMHTGEYFSKQELCDRCTEISAHWVDMVEPEDVEDFVKQIPSMTDIEGFVIWLNNGQMVKIKTEWYMALHHTKDSVNSPRRLFECVINETTDDLRAMFHDDPVAIKLITDMEEKVVPIYSTMIKTVEDFYEQNKELDRKSYAIKGQQVDDGLFGLKMNRYIGRSNDYKEFAIKHPEMFGVKDAPPQEVE